MRSIFILGILFLAASTSGVSRAGTPLVECEGTEVKAIVDQLTKDVYMVRMKFPSGVGFNFQTNGIIRSDRGFAAMGTRGLVYTKGEDGSLAGWIALGDVIFKDLSCTYLH